MPLKDREDAFGHYFLDRLNGYGDWAITERDDGLIEVDKYYSELYLADLKKWPWHEKEALKLAEGRVLDIGCGGGRHSLYLQEKGCDVVAIDSSPVAIEVCRKRGVHKAKVQDITKISRRLGVFETVLLLGNNFGLVSNVKRADWVFRKLKHFTAPDARILAESMDPYETERPDYLEYHARNKSRGRMAGQIKMRVRYKKYATPWFDYLLVSQKEMTGIVEGTGWKISKFIESKDRPQYIAVIERNP